MPTRRAFLASTAAVLVSSNRLFAASSTPALKSLEPFLKQLEQEKGGRIGVAVLDTQTGTRAGYRADEAFPMCSTFKLALTAHVLTRVDRGEEKLDRLVTYTQEEVLSYAPVTKEHVATG